jgi:benzoyl-CoA 2,3-dioxygenase component B
VELFGGEISSNAADYFAAGLKGRHHEQRKYSEHTVREGIYEIPVIAGDRMSTQEVPLRNAMNELLRDEYIVDCKRGCARWNKTLKKAGVDFEFSIPSRRFNREMGIYSGSRFSPAGDIISDAEFEAKRDTWLPTADDRSYVRSLMVPVYEPGQFAPWIAPPRKGVKGKPIEYDYVQFHDAS